MWVAPVPCTVQIAHSEHGGIGFLRSRPTLYFVIFQLHLVHLTLVIIESIPNIGHLKKEISISRTIEVEGTVST